MDDLSDAFNKIYENLDHLFSLGRSNGNQGMNLGIFFQNYELNGTLYYQGT